MPPAPVSVASTWDARPLAVCGVSGSRDRVEFSLRIRRFFKKNVRPQALQATGGDEGAAVALLGPLRTGSKDAILEGMGSAPKDN